MKYFKHMSIMSDDTKIKRLKRKYGLQGYGLYVLILEYISKQLDKHSPLPDLQEKAEDIADEWGCDIREVNEMMLMMVDEGLFEVDYISGSLVCTKIEKYLDEYIKKIPEIGKALKDFKSNQTGQFLTTQGISDGVRQTPTKSDFVPLEETRIEENRREEGEHASGKKKKIQHPLGVPIGEKRYATLCDTYGQKMVDGYIQKIVDYVASTGKKYKDYAATAANWIRRDEEQGKVKPIRKVTEEVPEWAKE